MRFVLHGRGSGAFAAALIVAALTLAFARAIPSAERPVEISIHSNDYPLSALLYIAVEEKLFERHGVRVRLVESPAGKVSIERMLAGEADMVVAADIPVVFAALAGQPILVVVSNLLDNAAEYMAHGGLVGLRASTHEGVATIEVQDRGTGIAPELLPRVFELLAGSNGGRPGNRADPAEDPYRAAWRNRVRS